MRLLLISNSTNAGEEYLKYPVGDMASFLGDIKEVLFVPFAAVTYSYDEYAAKVQKRLDEIGVRVRPIHREASPIGAICTARAVMVGGGNTFALIKRMQELGLVQALRERIKEGLPYIGWSAGSNVACPTIRTTNDMPIVEPESFDAIGAIRFQINPHYLDANPAGHAGETREQRIEEFIAANPDIYVAGLREGCMLHIEGDRLELKGPKPMRVFHAGEKPREFHAGDDLSFLMR